MRDRVDEILSAWRQERPDLDASPMGVIGRISRAARLLEGRMEEDYRQFGLIGADFDVLATLRRSGAPYQLTPTVLYRASMLSSGAMTHRLDRLERAGFIRRDPNPDDRRGTFVSLTEQGRQITDAAVASHVQFEADLLGGLSPDQRDILASALRELLVSLGDTAESDANR